VFSSCNKQVLQCNSERGANSRICCSPEISASPNTNKHPGHEIKVPLNSGMNCSYTEVFNAKAPSLLRSGNSRLSRGHPLSGQNVPGQLKFPGLGHPNSELPKVGPEARHREWVRCYQYLSGEEPLMPFYSPMEILLEAVVNKTQRRIIYEEQTAYDDRARYRHSKRVGIKNTIAKRRF
jgi:hypothetical protein